MIAVIAALVLGGAAWGIYKYQSSTAVPSRLTILVSGRTEGFLENCGCSGGQAGGMHRRATMIKARRAEVTKPIRSDEGKSSETLTLDTGDFSDSNDERQKLRSKGIVKAMEMIGYDSVGLGQNELGFTQQELHELLREGQLLYLAANIKFVKPDEGEDFSSQLTEQVKPYKVIPLKGGYKLGMIHVLDNAGITRGEPIK
ncbi:MAG: hypothetical protein M3R04_08875, partial [bacterium]|nr:hypothetical protein [bacterium]